MDIVHLVQIVMSCNDNHVLYFTECLRSILEHGQVTTRILLHYSCRADVRMRQKWHCNRPLGNGLGVAISPSLELAESIRQPAL